MAEQRIAIVNENTGEVWCVSDWDEERYPDWRPPFPEHKIIRNPPDFIGVGWLYDKATQQWTQAPTPRVAEIPLGAFLDRLTEDEHLAIISAESTSNRLKMMKERIHAAPVVNLDDRRTRDYLALMESLGILSSSRISQIVT